MQDEGKIRFVGVSAVSVEQLRRARELVDVVTVQNRFNYSERGAEDVLTVCEAEQIGFIPWNPLGHRRPRRTGECLNTSARTSRQR